MKKNTENGVDLGDNIKHLMKAFRITQAQLADKLDMPVSQMCNLLQKPDIDDGTLQKIAGAMGNGVSVDMIRNYNHDDTISYIINNYTQNVENGGTGTLIPSQDNSSTQNVENGGTGTLIPSQDNSSTQNVENGGTGTLIPSPTQNVENGGTGTLIPSPTQKVENGGTGTLIPSQDNSTNSTSTFENGSQPTINHYVAEQAFESMKEIAELKTEIMRLRMKYESGTVEAEIKKKKA